MDTNALFRRGRALLLLCIFLISACSSTPPEPERFPTVTPRPTETRVPTVTPIPGGVLPRGDLFPESEEITRTPAPTLTLLPGNNVYDPLSPTQTARAALPTEPLPVMTIPPEFGSEPIPTGKLTGGVVGLIPSPQGLWGMRSNGTQMTLITADPIDRIAFSPSGSLGVYLTHPNPNTTIADQPYGYMLKLITVYDNATYPIALLDPPGISAESPLAVLDAAAASLAAYERGALAWSPNGARVAFTSSHEAVPGQPAPSDIYLYTPSSGSIQRITSLSLPNGPAHAYDLEWSPDSSRLYYSAAYSFTAPGSSGGTWVAGSWVAGLDGSNIQLYDGSPDTGFNMIDWLPASSLLANTPDITCGARDLRVVRLTDGKVTNLWPGCYADYIYDQRRAEVIVSITPEFASIPGSPGEGVYRVRLWDPTPEQITTMGFDSLYIGSGAHAWYGFNPGQGIYAISRTGTLTPQLVGPPYDNSTGVVLKPLQRLARSTTWLFTGSPGGLYRATPGKEVEKLLDLPIEGWTTSPSFPTLHFFYSPGVSGLQLYGVRESDWQPFPIDDRLRSPDSIRWVP